MKLKYPDSDVDFNITPAIVLGGFDIYDREEGLGERLNGFNPNNHDELLEIYSNFSNLRNRKYTLEHKKIIVETVLEALLNPNYNFGELLKDNDDECLYLPTEWDIKNPRSFFLSAYIWMISSWSVELDSAGYNYKRPNEL